MNVCVMCGKEVTVERYVPRKAACPHCGGDLHICLNCAFHSGTSHNQCIETKAEFQRSRDRANFCEYFKFREGAAHARGGAGDAKAGAKKAFDDLFRD